MRPTTERSFSPGDRVAMVTRLYQGGRRRLEPVRVAVRIVGDDDRVALTEVLTLDSAAFGDLRQADYRLELPLDRLAPGEHLLTIEATVGEVSVRRDVRFAIQR
jgi:hypothetical protein